MRIRRASMVLASVIGFVPAVADAQYTPQSLLTRYVPVFRGVDYDLPATVVKGEDPAVKAAVEACKVETNARGFTVRDGQGKLLRRFVDTNGKEVQREGEKKPGTHLDQWSYYLDGFEVYREVDSDEDGSLDEVRWMNSGGTRVAKVKPNPGGRGSQIVAWTRISAEEASKVLVQGIVQGDRALIETVLATPEELESIGIPAATIKRAADAAAARDEALQELLGTVKQTGWNAQTAWSRFDGAMPHVIPPDAAPGLKGEVMLYENVVVFADSGNAASAAKLAYLSAPDVVKIGDSWKFVELPRAIDPTKPPAAGTLVSLRTDIFRSGGGTGPAVDPKMVAAMKKLADFDAEGLKAGKSKADWHVERSKILKDVIDAQTDPAEKLNYQKQVVNDLAEAVKAGVPEGMGVLDKLIAGGGKIGSFAAYRKILVQFDQEAEEPGANLLKVQTDSLARFEKFLKDYAQADEVPEVLLQLATVNDFNGTEKEARDWYAKLAQGYPATEPGKKAQGALKRLDIDGKPLKVAGTTLDGKAASTEDFRGKPVLVVYWSSAMDSDLKELKELADLRQKLGPKGFDVLAVNLDGDKAAAEAAVKANPAPWSTIYEPGGMDGRLANELGIISTPTMILLDSKGLVANRKIRKAAEIEKALDKTLAGRGVGLNTGVR